MLSNFTGRWSSPIDGLLIALAWQALLTWATLLAGIVWSTIVFLHLPFEPASVLCLTILSSSGFVYMWGVGVLTSRIESPIRRMMHAFPLMIPCFALSTAGMASAPRIAPVAVIALLLAALGLALAYHGRSKWLALELG